MGPTDPCQGQQELSSKKIIVEAKMALLSLKKDSGIFKGSKWPEDWAAVTWEGPKCPKNWYQTNYKNGAEMTWVEMTRVWNGLSLVSVNHDTA